MTAVHPVWRNYLFDLDGTLIDSSPLHDRAYRMALGKYRADLIPTFSYDAVKAKTTIEGLRSLGIMDSQQLAVLVADKQRHFRDAVARGQLSALDGAHELLGDLKRIGRRLFVVSSGSRGSVSAALGETGLASYFEHVITADDVALGKPAPDGYLFCVAQFGLSTSETVAIEDALVGIAAARAACLAVIAVHDKSVAEHADLFFPNFHAFRSCLSHNQVSDATAP